MLGRAKCKSELRYLEQELTIYYGMSSLIFSLKKGISIISKTQTLRPGAPTTRPVIWGLSSSILTKMQL